MNQYEKTISMILALVMVLGLLPAAVFATGTNNVYISVSFDGRYIDDQNGSPIVYVPVSLDAVASVDLNEYGLSEYLYDPDGDGSYETTALQLVIYAHENIYGGDWSDVTFTGGAGSSYFAGGIFGFTENLNYFLNGEFPIDEALSEGSSFAVGATSDHIVLEAGDFIDIASFTSFAFLWDSAAGFHLFADENDGFVHSYTTKAGEAVDVKLLRSYSNMADGSAVLAAESGYALSYGAAFGTADGTVTTDATIRQQCVDAIVAAQHDDGGWSLMANKTYASDPDITGMALTALYPYRDQAAVAEACAEAIACLSGLQHDNGTFASGGAECSESCAWVIIGCTAWGINPDTDPRFIKNGSSVVDGLLAHYVEEVAMFQHIIGAGSNAMGTDQGCYGLVAYDRFVKGKAALYDYSDVTFDTAPEADKMTAILGLPEKINEGDSFNAVISTNQWDNEAGYKLIDFIMTVPEGLSVTDVTPSDRLSGGDVLWNLESETGKLRVVYFDANENTTLTVSGEEFPAELFTISFKADTAAGGSKLDIAISGMSVKLSSDSADEAAMIVVNTETARGTVTVVEGISFSAVCLYTGDDVDLIPATRKAVAVAVTGISGGTKLSYHDGTNKVEFKYSAEISEKTGVSTYVALVDAAIPMEHFVNDLYFTIPGGNAPAITFGDSNGDGIINAQDALAAVDAWLRKGEAPDDDGILTMNVNGDSRINTFDALGIVEKFVSGSEYGVVTKAATITTNQ